MNLDALKAFVVFSETRNFTRAAETLHISQPALHVKIRKLSESLGVALYSMNGKELVLTAQGKEVARFGREAEEYVNDFVEQLSLGNAFQPVTLAAGAGAYMNLLGEAILHFKSSTKAALRLITADRPTTLELLHAGKAHLGVTVLEDVPEDMQAQLLRQVRPVFVVPATHRLAKKKSVSIRDLHDLELILPARDKPHRATIERTFAAHGVVCRVAIETSGWDLMIRFVQLGLGQAIVNGCCAIPRGLKALPIREFPTTNYYLLSKRSIRLNENQQTLAKLIKQHARN